MEKLVSICIPFIRPQNIELLIEKIIQTVGIGIGEYEILTSEDTERIGCPKMLKRLVERAVGKYIAFIGDDTDPQPNWLTNALEYMNFFEDGIGLVGLSDKTKRTLPTHWVANRRMLELLDGEFFHTGYHHCFCDKELMERCETLGKYAFAFDAIVLHRHPLIDQSGAIMDEDYKRIYSEEIFFKDKDLFEERRKLWSGSAK